MIYFPKPYKSVSLVVLKYYIYFFVSTAMINKDDLDKPLDIDQNVLSNLLQSYSEELGHGPVSSLFQSMKVNPGRKDWLKF